MSRFLQLIRPRLPKMRFAPPSMPSVHLAGGAGVRRRSRRLAFIALGVVAMVAAGAALTIERAQLPEWAREWAAADLQVARARAQALARERLARRVSVAGHNAARAVPAVFRERTAESTHARALFATHSWYVPPPPPPPVVPPPPPPPSAPPFPYTFVGSYAPLGQKPVYFLARADRVTDAHVGDRLDGVYEFESAGPDGLVFNYLPLNIRQTLPTGVSQ
jgi:hypothetical protein